MPNFGQEVFFSKVTDEQLRAKIDEILKTGSMEDLTMNTVKAILITEFGDMLNMEVRYSVIADIVQL